MQTNSSVRSSPCSARRELLAGALPLFVLLLAGCGHVAGERIIPVFRAIPSASAKPGRHPHETLVVLPRKGVASVYLHFRYKSGRASISDVAIVNHYPDKVTLFATKSRVYVDKGGPIKIARYRDFDRRQHKEDFQILRDLPKDATDPKGTWLFPEPQPVTKYTVRGPTIILFYSVHGHDGFVKVRYRAIWDIPGE